MSEKQENRTIIVAGLWETRNGHFQSMPVDAKGYDILTRVFENGGKFLIRRRTEEAISRSANPQNAPVAYLEFVPKDAVEAFKAQKFTNTKGPL